VTARGPAPTRGAAGVRVLRFAPAKLNLTLAVVGRREDGYHALHSVMVPLALGDAVAVFVAPAGARGDTLRIAGLPLPATADDLVLRAIGATRAAVRDATWSGDPADPPPLAARLTKRIPVAAGLGGGSSDAAASIAAALEAWGASLSPARAAEVAASLGSDVPFFLAGGVALVAGRGEFVEPLPDLRGEAPAVLIVTPRLHVSTPAVFAAYGGGARAAEAGAALAVSERLVADLRSGLATPDLLARAEELAAANDLLPATLSVAPPLAEFRRALQGILGRPVGQSGSGPTAWVLYRSLATARKAARFVRLGIRDGSLPPIGAGEPFVAATAILSRGSTTSTTHPAGAHNVGRSESDRTIGRPTRGHLDPKGR
jgi:4-diphosphocytidyl-2-C-methyl-D-erythritol kinase